MVLKKLSSKITIFLAIFSLIANTSHGNQLSQPALSENLHPISG